MDGSVLLQCVHSLRYLVRNPAAVTQCPVTRRCSFSWPWRTGLPTAPHSPALHQQKPDLLRHKSCSAFPLHFGETLVSLAVTLPVCPAISVPPASSHPVQAALACSAPGKLAWFWFSSEVSFLLSQCPNQTSLALPPASSP